MSTAAEICVDLFGSVDLPLAPGMTSEQLDRIEYDFGFNFDRDHREILSLVTPLGDGWLDWRAASPMQTRAMLAWPTEGELWDVHNNDFWPRAWGRKPKRPEARGSAVLNHLAHVSKLVPLNEHGFMAAGPSKGSAPVFSVYQIDVIYYGENLPDYVAHELHIPKRFTTGVHRKIPFWSALAENNRRYLRRPLKDGRAFWNRSILGGSPLPSVARDGNPITYSIGDADIQATEELPRRLNERGKQ